MIALMLGVGLLGGCLEQTTGESKPLDPRYYEGVEAGQGPAAVSHDDGQEHEDVASPGGSAAEHGEVQHAEVEHSDGAKPGGPFEGFDGERVTVGGTLSSELSLPIDLDFRAKEPESEGGWRQLGKVFVSGPGPWSLSVPAGFGAVKVEAFQDPAENGPDDGDPFAVLEFMVGDEDQEALDLTLIVGGRELAQAANAGAPAPTLFKEHQGEWTTLSGLITSPIEGAVSFDLRVPDSESPTGDRYLGKVLLPSAGAYELQLPRSMGGLVVEAFQDVGSNGPDAADPYARLTLDVADVAALDLDLELVQGARKADPRSLGQGEQGGGAPAQAGNLFGEIEDPVTVSGRIELTGAELKVLDMDLFTRDPQAPGGRKYLGKIKVAPGDFSFQAPRGYGILELEVYGDTAGDGPSPGDPFGLCAQNPVTVGNGDVGGLTVEVSPTSK